MRKLPVINNKYVIWGIIWVLAVGMIITLIYFIPKASGALTPTSIAEYNTVFESDNVNCYLVKRETVTYAKNSGKAVYDVKEGSRVRADSSVVRVGRNSYTAEASGEVSYTADGYESYFTEDNISNLKKDEVQQLNITQNKLKKDVVEKGDPLFKSIDDKKWYMVFWVNKDLAINYEEGEIVDVILDAENRVSAKVSGIYHQKDDYLIVLATNGYYDKLVETRNLDIEIVRINVSGLLINKSSIVTIDGQTGVYVKQINGDNKFVRVKVLCIADDKAIVASDYFTEIVDSVTEQVTTINAYDEIIKNGKSMNKGGEKK